MCDIFAFNQGHKASAEYENSFLVTFFIFLSAMSHSILAIMTPHKQITCVVLSFLSLFAKPASCSAVPFIQALHVVTYIRFIFIYFFFVFGLRMTANNTLSWHFFYS